MYCETSVCIVFMFLALHALANLFANKEGCYLCLIRVFEEDHSSQNGFWSILWSFNRVPDLLVQQILLLIVIYMLSFTTSFFFNLLWLFFPWFCCLDIWCLNTEFSAAFREGTLGDSGDSVMPDSTKGASTLCRSLHHTAVAKQQNTCALNSHNGSCWVPYLRSSANRRTARRVLRAVQPKSKPLTQTSSDTGD